MSLLSCTSPFSHCEAPILIESSAYLRVVNCLGVFHRYIDIVFVGGKWDCESAYIDSLWWELFSAKRDSNEDDYSLSMNEMNQKSGVLI